jgi:hypothetical protein
VSNGGGGASWKTVKRLIKWKMALNCDGFQNHDSIVVGESTSVDGTCMNFAALAMEPLA